MNDTTGARLEAYKAQQEHLVKKYNGQIIAMVNGEFVGAYETKLNALNDVQARFPGGAYFIIKCTSGNEEYTRRLRSRSMQLHGMVLA